MPTFHYKAMTAAGASISADLDAADRNELMRKLRKQDLVPLEITEKRGTGQPFAPRKNRFSSTRISRKHITQFTTQLSALLNAKMNLGKALLALERQSENTNINPVIKSLLEDVNKGKNLSDALASFPAYFPDLYVNMVKIGEVGGVLDKSLTRLVDMRTKDEDLMGKIKGALAYPCVMATVMLGSVIVMLTFVIPRFSSIFSQMGAGLPITTRIVISLSNLLASWWWLVIIILGGLVGTGLYLLRRKEYRIKFDRMKLSLPLLGGIIHEICISRYSLSMGALLSSGVSMMKALDATIPVTGNTYLEETLRGVSKEVREGDSLSNALRKRSEVFPRLMIGMVGTGEESGSLDEMLINVGEYYRKNSEEKINTLTTLFEPAMIVVMGSIVGFIISAILLPIFNISSAIH